MIRSKRAKEFLGCDYVTIPHSDAIEAVELAESDARERAVRAHLKAQSGSKKFLDKATIAGKRFVTLRDPARPNTLIEVETGKYKKRLKRYAGMEVVGEGTW